jgi:hypothetical protein
VGTGPESGQTAFYQEISSLSQSLAFGYRVLACPPSSLH